MQTQTFITAQGIATIIERGLWTNPYTQTVSIIYDCRVLTPHGIIEGQTLMLATDEELTQELVENAVSCTTAKGRTTNRANTDKLRNAIKNRKK